MFADADHEVIDSTEALFRHLYEEHGVEEARDLDPATAPVQFWLRRHADLERAQRSSRRNERAPQPEPRPQAEGRPEPEGPPAPDPRPRPSPTTARGRGRAERGRAEAGPAPGQERGEPGATGREGRRPAPFGDPLVEAMARALAGRGHEEAAVRSAIRSFTSADGQPAGEASIRAAFVEPMLRTVAEHLLGTGGPHGPAQWTAPPMSSPAAQSRSAPAAPSTPPARAPAPEPEPVRPEAAWAVLWADLADTGPRGGGGPGEGAGDGDDLMAVADAVQARRRVRLLRR